MRITMAKLEPCCVNPDKHILSLLLALIPDSVTMPVSLGSTLRYLLQKSADSRAKKSTLPMKYPAVWPTELQVEA